MARIELALGRTEQALKRVEASRARVIETGAGLALPQTQVTLAAVRASLGHHDEARASLEDIIESGADFGWMLSWAMMELAVLLRANGDTDGAESYARRANEISERVGSRVRHSWAKELLGRLAADRGAWTEAEALLHDALAIQAEKGMSFWLSQTLDGFAELFAGLARHEEAARLLGAGDRARCDFGFVRWPLDGPRFESLERELRREMGDEAFETAWRQGERLTLDETVAWLRRGRGSRKRYRSARSPQAARAIRD
jgi:hypothetical protein